MGSSQQQQLVFRSTQPGPLFVVGRHNEYQQKLEHKRPSTRFTSLLSVVWQCKLVSVRGLRKLRSVLPYDCYGSGMTLHCVYAYGC